MKEVKKREKGKGGSNGEKQSDRDRVGLKEMEAEMKEHEGGMNMESSEDWFDLPLIFSPSSYLPPSSFFSPPLCTFSEGSLGQTKSARSELAGPSVSWLIAEVSLCQMNNRVSLPITNLPARARP